MGYVIPPGFSRVVLEFASYAPTGSKPCFGFGIDNSPSDAIVEGVYAWWLAEQRALTTDGMRLERVVARNDTEVAEKLVSSPGSETANTLPPNSAVLISMSSGLTGRSNRGRVYLPGCLYDDTVADGGQLDLTSLANLQDSWDALEVILDGLAASFVILHSDSSDPTPVTASVVQPLVATQRRRLRR